MVKFFAILPIFLFLISLFNTGRPNFAICWWSIWRYTWSFGHLTFFALFWFLGNNVKFGWHALSESLHEHFFLPGLFFLGRRRITYDLSCRLFCISCFLTLAFLHSFSNLCPKNGLVFVKRLLAHKPAVSSFQHTHHPLDFHALVYCALETSRNQVLSNKTL